MTNKHRSLLIILLFISMLMFSAALCSVDSTPSTPTPTPVSIHIGDHTFIELIPEELVTREYKGIDVICTVADDYSLTCEESND